MSWPTMTDYQEAIQNPHLCFNDSDLKHGSPEPDLLGLPRPVTGGFASVYQMNCNGRKYAVRCFLRQYPDRERRYTIISSHLKKAGLPFMVDFEFLPQGIKVGNQWYPILKMEWVEGDPLNKHIEENINNQRAIQDLAEKFLKLTADLRLASISHGDLQHGNILVVNGELILIDYDGMYVPGLKNMSSQELGHRNYQHPSRTEKDFGPELDNFSAWVIYLSLVALGTDKKLWQRAGDSDECLLFRQRDFENPDTSSILSTLRQSQDRQVQALAAFLLSLIPRTDLSQIPSLNQTPVTRSSLRVATTIAGQLKSRQKSGLPTMTETAQKYSSTTGASWVLDYLEPVQPVDMSCSCFKERLLLGAFAASAISLAYAALSGLLTFMSAGSAISGLFTIFPLVFTMRFRALPEVAKKYKLLSKTRNLQNEIKQLERAIKRLSEKKNKLDEVERQKTEEITSKQQEITLKKDNNLADINHSLQVVLANLNLQRRRLKQAQTSEIALALKDIQSKFMPQSLATHDLTRAHIRGIGPEIKKRLLAAGIRTAADIADIHTVRTKTGWFSKETAYIEVFGRGKVHIEGMGTKKAKAILAWRQDIESGLKSQIPNSIPPALEATIQAKYQPGLQELDSREYIARQEGNKKKNDLRAENRQAQNALAREISEIQNTFTKQRRELEKEIFLKNDQLTSVQLTLAGAQQELTAFQSVNFITYLKHVLFL